MPARLLLALPFAVPLILATEPCTQAIPPPSTEFAMRCVQARMTDPLLPVTVSPEQVAQVALASCADAIEVLPPTCASEVGAEGRGAPRGRIEAARTRRRMLLDYVPDAAIGATAVASVVPVSKPRPRD